MHKKRIVALIIFFSFNSIINTIKAAQTTPSIELEPEEIAEDPFLRPRFLKKIKEYLPVVFSGYIKYEAFYDTRQVLGVTNDEILVFPDRQVLDPNGKDINAKGQGDMLAVESRLRATIEGPKINSADSFGVIEADFLGFNELGFRGIDRVEILNLYRLRHAFMQLDWEKYTLIAGQAWHPVFLPLCYPDTISFNTGTPFEPFSRNPQLRFTYHNEKISIMAAALSQVRFVNDGPDGFRTKYLRDAVVPNLHGQLKIKIGDHSLIASLDYKRLVPRIVTNKGFKVRESINSILAFWLACLEWPSFYIRSKFVFEENGTNFGMLGGYAVKTIDPVTDERTYTNLHAIAFWMDILVRKSEKIQPGLFIGATKNLGASKKIKQNITDASGTVIERRVFGIGNDIDTVFRISPRFRWYIKKVVAGAELEYTRATYGTLTNKGKVINTTPVGNVRFLFAVYYYF